MTLFGRTLDTQEIASLVFMILALVLWISVYRGERRWAGWLRTWNADRKARREAEDGPPPPSPGEPRGPWG